MRKIKVTLYEREPETRRYKRINPKKDYPPTTIFVLRYRSTWETLKVTNVDDAGVARLQRELDLFRGWRPTARPKSESKNRPVMLDAAMDSYLAEIQASKKPKTYGAYRVSLRYFFESVGNKSLNQINRADLLDFSVFLREEKNQADRSTYNKFENVMTFLKHHDITGKSLKIKSHDWPKFVEEEPEIYEQETLDRFFDACNEDESILFEHFDDLHRISA